MRVLKKSAKKRPRVSLILLDWGVRESFHLLHYLGKQTIPRQDFEVILVEFHSTISECIQEFNREIDTLIALDMPDDCYYHKHLMYNVGIAFSAGEILMFADSDAMVRPTFLQTVVDTFERDLLIVYHMDEFRNTRRDLYPFSYPSFEEVTGDGCVNFAHGKTKGILDNNDSVHSRNYGACMCARRADIIAIGGADEDLTYLGHICGPYDMTFRLVHFGRRLHWESEEFLYHTWHPGSDGVENYLGPHDGRNMSTTALQALCAGRIAPLVENEAIRRLRTEQGTDLDREILPALVDPGYADAFKRSRLSTSVGAVVQAPALPKELYASYHGFDVYQADDAFYAVPQRLGPIDVGNTGWRTHELVIKGSSFADISKVIDEADGVRLLETIGSSNICSLGERYAVVPLELGIIDFHIPSHHGNPRITWTNSLEDARGIASKAAILAPGAPHEPNSRLQERICELDERLGSVESILRGGRQSENRVVELEQRLLETELALQEVRASLREPERRIVGLEHKLESAVSDQQELREGFLERAKHITELDHLLGDAQTGLQELRERFVLPEKRIGELERRLNDAESGVVRVDERLRRPEGRIPELQRELAGIEAALRAICFSRTWRTLTWIGGVVLRLGGRSDPRKDLLQPDSDVRAVEQARG